MVSRDPETGMFVPEGNDMGPEDPYLNTKQLWYVTATGDAETGNFDRTGLHDDRNAATTWEPDLPDNHLLEIHGVASWVGDTVEDPGKFDVWYYNGSGNDQGWSDQFGGPNHDKIMVHHSHQIADGQNGGYAAETWFPKPFLNPGKVHVAYREGPNGEAEAAGQVYYTIREFDENTVMREMLDDLA